MEPFIVAIWCGPKKPDDLTAYLQPFVDELNRLLRNGIIINDNKIVIVIRCIICDTPARCFLKGSTLLFAIRFIGFTFILMFLLCRNCFFQSHIRMPKLYGDW